VTAPVRPPTRLLGRVSEFEYEAILDEVLSDLPADLHWPLSVRTYASVQRDPTAWAALQGYILQLLRATWQLDGRGCDPKLTALVADDMGLPVVGGDEPGANFLRGVSWEEHIRAALLGALTYGHAGFELGAEVSGGEARLVTLAERPAHTITQIHADGKTGAFEGITQDAPRRNGRPQIPARQLAWYCHQRQGAAWQGISLFRQVAPIITIKREMIRVHATSNRRWGMGVPVMEALPGTVPTPQQMVEAQQLASAARSGEQAGAATPPGFQLKLTGISGSLPATLDFLAWLDRQILRAVLMPHLELGQGTSGGARALGEAFIDSWTLGLESLGQAVSDVATRQIAARIVEWNAGPDAPVPRVVVSGIGSRREVTAESLSRLLDAGALSSDPALEAWVRREYRLPEREQSEQATPSGRIFESDVAQGVLTRNERRAMFNLPPVEGGDSLPDMAPVAGRTPAVPQTESEDEVFAAAPNPTDPAKPQEQPRQPTRGRIKARQAAGQLALNIAAAGAGAGHPDTCETAGLTTPCRCGCNGTRHGESVARSRLGRIRTETIEREGRTVRLAAMNDDELADQFAQASRDENWDAFNTIVAEMDRREQDARAFDGPQPEDHWNLGDDGVTDQEREVDARLARGWSYADAYADVYGGDADRVRQQERSSSVDRSAGESTDQAVRRAYDQFVHEQWLRAEADTSGHMLTREAQAAGIQPVDLFSGNSARARRYASEDLQRWWAANGGRTTFTQYRAQVLGRSRDRRSAERTRLQSNSRDFI
jgi:hypothetical protein